jgi:putative membrane protein
MPEQDKDPRVYFAAERTFLAWIRTGLALMGFGFVVARFGMILRELGSTTAAMSVKSSGFSLWTGTVLVLIGVLVNGVSAFQHLKTIRELNEGRDVTGRLL